MTVDGPFLVVTSVLPCGLVVQFGYNVFCRDGHGPCAKGKPNGPTAQPPQKKALNAFPLLGAACRTRRVARAFHSSWRFSSVDFYTIRSRPVVCLSLRQAWALAHRDFPHLRRTTTFPLGICIPALDTARLQFLSAFSLRKENLSNLSLTSRGGPRPAVLSCLRRRACSHAASRSAVLPRWQIHDLLGAPDGYLLFQQW